MIASPRVRAGLFLALVALSLVAFGARLGRGGRRQGPGQPSLAYTVNGFDEITVAWPQVTGAGQYTLWRGATSGGPYLTQVYQGATGNGPPDGSGNLYYFDTQLAAGTYYYVLTVTVSGATSPASTELPGTAGKTRFRVSPRTPAPVWFTL